MGIKEERYLLASIWAGISVLLFLDLTLSESSDVLVQFLIATFSLLVLILTYFGRAFVIWIGILFFSFLSFTFLAAALEFPSFLYGIIGFLYSFLVWRLIRVITLKKIKKDEVTGPEIQLPAQTFIANQIQFEYPLLLRRIQALFIDGMLLLLFMIIVMVATEDHINAVTIRIVSAVIVSTLYEPLLTVYAHTLGQQIMGIRVRNVADPSKRISVLQSYIRLFIKGFFGWISFLTIHFNSEHRAIHDLAGSSVMIKLRKQL